jgi:hypothetical protein
MCIFNKFSHKEYGKIMLVRALKKVKERLCTVERYLIDYHLDCLTNIIP